MKWLGVSRILVKESLGRSVRILGHAGLAMSIHPDCNYAPHIESEIQEVIDRLERLDNILKGLASVEVRH